MIEIDWEMVKANLDRLTDESLAELRDRIVGIILDRSVKQYEALEQGERERE